MRDESASPSSSRNAYLSERERERALALPRALQTGDAARARALLAEAGVQTDYIDVLEENGFRVLAGAIRIGSTRLIDNVPLEGESQ